MQYRQCSGVIPAKAGDPFLLVAQAVAWIPGKRSKTPGKGVIVELRRDYFRFPLGMAESGKDISGLGFEELKALLVQALEQNARLKTENAELREEIARLKGLKGRPKLKPSGMDKAAEAGAAKGSRKRASMAPSGRSSV